MSLTKEELEGIRLDAFRGHLDVSQHRALLADRDSLATSLEQALERERQLREALDAALEELHPRDAEAIRGQYAVARLQGAKESG